MYPRDMPVPLSVFALAGCANSCRGPAYSRIAGAAKYVTANVGKKVTMFVCQIFRSFASSVDMARPNSAGESALLARNTPRHIRSARRAWWKNTPSATVFGPGPKTRSSAVARRPSTTAPSGPAGAEAIATTRETTETEKEDEARGPGA